MQRRDRNGLKTREIPSLTREKNFVLAEREKERGEGGTPICRRGEQVLFARGKEEQQVEERKNRFSFKKSTGHPIVEKNTDRIPRRIAMSRHRYTEREREEGENDRRGWATMTRRSRRRDARILFSLAVHACFSTFRSVESALFI